MAKRIFVVDDEKCIADTLVTILRKSGYESSAFYDAKSALAACKAAAPELIISDVVMPGMSGVDMAVRVKQQHPNCKVLLFSGNAATSDLLEDARGLGYDFELLAKPIHPKDLLAKVAAVERRPPRSEGVQGFQVREQASPDGPTNPGTIVQVIRDLERFLQCSDTSPDMAKNALEVSEYLKNKLTGEPKMRRVQGRLSSSDPGEQRGR
jgi:DNA-binding response OmpR family regulator